MGVHVCHKKTGLRYITALMTVFFCLSAAAVFSQEISVQAELSARKVTLGTAIQLTITVEGESNVSPVELPAMEGFDVKYLGPTTRMSYVNGQQSISKSFIYSLFPLKEGQLEIPQINVIVAGKTYTLNPIFIEVVAAGTPDVSPTQQPKTIEEQLYVVLKVPKNEVYLNEPLPIKIILFDGGPLARNVQYPTLDGIGFTMGDFKQPQQYQQIISDLRYNIVEFDNTIYPTRAGELKLGPVKLLVNIVVNAPSSGQGFRGSPFDDDFFNAFFNRQQTRPMDLESEPVTVNVLPLPEEGKPADFTGAVGRYDFNVSVSPATVKVGDPITLRLTVIGQGNLSAIEMPKFPLDAGFKLYDPQIFEKDTVKKSEQVIIPQSEGIKEVPALNFSYFDPELKQYHTITQGPFPIQVQKLEEGEEFKVVGLEAGERNVLPETLGEDIVFIKMSSGNMRLRGEFFYNSWLLVGMIAGFAFGWTGIFIYFRRTHRIKTDIVYARRLQAPRQAKQGLAKAKKMIAAGKKEEFYDTVFKTLQQYMGNKLHLSSGAVTFETIQAALQSRNIEAEIISDVKTVFEECDMIRYAMAQIDEPRMRQTYQLLANSIDHLERHLK